MTTDEQIIDALDEAQEIIPFTYAIASYGADYPIDSLVKRIDNKDILVPTFEHEEQLADDVDAFQREYVWPRPKADRFIESLLLGLPVPGIFLVKEDTGRLLVLDGHQRLYTLQCFYNGIIHGHEYRLAGIQARFNGKTYKELDVEDRRRLDDSIIHATIVKQEEPSEDWSSIYSIFERLNTGGISLQPQEIRMALYHGNFSALLRELNTFKDWRTIMGPVSKRLKDVEIILRFFALLYHYSVYSSPMKDFLNRYMATNKHLQKRSGSELKDVFIKTASALSAALGADAFRPERAVNAALADALMVGVGTTILKGGGIDHGRIANARDALLKDEKFVEAISTGTSQKPKVELRITRAIAAIG